MGREDPQLQWGGFPAAWGKRGASGTRPTPCSPLLQHCFPRLRAASKRKGRKNHPFVCRGQSLGRGRGEKKKKTTRGWSAGETFDSVFLAILFLGRKSSWGCSAEGTGRSQEHPRPTQGPKFSWQRPLAPSTKGARFKAQRSQEKLKSETV